MYTYILKDRLLGMYKIGRSKKPQGRFKALCRIGSIAPLALVERDIEKLLHTKFSEFRVSRADFKGNGGTEWFKGGGIFGDFIETIDKGTSIPYISPHSMTKHLLDEAVIKSSDGCLLWEMSEDKYAYHTIGLGILEALGHILTLGRTRTTKSAAVRFVKGKLLVTDELVSDIAKKYKIKVTREGSYNVAIQGLPEGTLVHRAVSGNKGPVEYILVFYLVL